MASGDLRRLLRGVMVLVACAPGKAPDSGSEVTSAGSGSTDATGGLSQGTTSAISTSGTTAVTGSTLEPTSTEPPATTDASATNASTGTSTTDTGTTGSPGGEYGPCQESDPKCPEGQACINFSELGVEVPGEYCAPMCMVDADCPAIRGGAMAWCFLDVDLNMMPEFCAAICEPSSPDPGCPAGTTCKEIPDQPEPIGVCTAP